MSREKRGFSTLLNIRSQSHNTPLCRCLKFQILKELAVQCIHILYTNVGTITSMIVDTKGHVLSHSVTFTYTVHLKTQHPCIIPQIMHNAHPPFTINGTAVEKVDNFKYLGVNIHEDLTWASYTTAVVRRAQQQLCGLRR